MNDVLVLAVFWLASGSPAFDYLPREQCEAVATMTSRTGSVGLELADGSLLTALRVECRELPIGRPQ